jgi:5-methylcytosine-specific restriction endonuclease McrA
VFADPIAVEELLEAADALRDRLAGFAFDALSAMGATRVVDALGRVERACGFARTKAGLRAVDLGAHTLAGVANPAEWLAAHAGMTAAQARAQLRLVTNQNDLTPTLEDALEAGDISMAQAAEIADALKDIDGDNQPDAGDDLLGQAKGHSLDHLRDQARAKANAGKSAEDLHDRQHKLRQIRNWVDRDGMIAILHKLTPEVGAAYLARLRAAATTLHRQQRRDGSTDSFQAHMADAFARMLGLDPAHPVHDSGGRGPNVELSIVVDRAALLRGEALDGEVCHIIGGGPIPVDLARLYATDAFLNGVLFEGTDILAIKRFGRRYPADLAAALNLGRPPTFTGPRCTDCGSTFRLQRDHINPVANGGDTTYANIAPRCDPCHQAKTEEDRKAGLLGSNPPTRNQFRNKARSKSKQRGQPPPREPTKERITQLDLTGTEG